MPVFMQAVTIIVKCKQPLSPANSKSQQIS